MDAEHTTPEDMGHAEQERVPYPEDQRQANLAKLLEVLGGPPPAEAIELAVQREAEFAARRSHAA
ncbi:hypothetical protein OHA25_60120 (plasmid) [Nonomuraea sp. NBC_00507]|uniref:hypothetical protein n=1 Tax=Nonomuraea sp. NBC_00507 TaxID=2976002 RepID=UPI002E1981D1